MVSGNQPTFLARSIATNPTVNTLDQSMDHLLNFICTMYTVTCILKTNPLTQVPYCNTKFDFKSVVQLALDTRSSV